MNGGGAPPVCAREGVYIEREDVFLISRSPAAGSARPDLWAYRADGNTWYRQAVTVAGDAVPARWSHQSSALVYDRARDLLMLVLGSGGDAGRAVVWALRYRFSR